MGRRELDEVGWADSVPGVIAAEGFSLDTFAVPAL